VGIFSIVGSLSTFVVNSAAAIASVSGSVAIIIASTWVKDLREAVAYVPQPIDMM
jgi:hypothetical protein